MWEAILGGIAYVVCFLLGVWVRGHFEERRWYAGYFLGRKIDALNNLYAALVDCHYAMNFYGNVPPSTLQEFKEKVQPKVETYLRTKVMASIYLDEKGDKIMSDALGAFRQASMAIFLSLPSSQCPVNKKSYPRSTRNLDWKKLSDTYEKAVSYLKNILNPKILGHVEKAK